jgi:hypothetical protein
MEIKVEKPATRTPPKKETSAKTTETQDTIHDKRAEATNGIFQIATFGCVLLGNFADAGAIDEHGPGISNEIANLADTNAYVAKATDAFMNVGPFAALFAATMPLVLQLMVNHNIIPAEKLANANVVHPDVLEARVKTAMMRQAMEAMAAQRMAQEEMQRMQAEMANAASNGQTQE